MNERAIEIIKIDKTSSYKSVYILNKEEFSEIIESCIDSQIVLISIAGPSRSGKSFLLSYFLNYLYDITEDDRSQMNKGFEWKKGVNPTTQGLWMWSKPFIFVDKKGTKIAVLLMDTQGVYDKFTDQRDWSTIFGISLLTSSCIIYNEFNQLNENMFINFESYLRYGLMATGSANTKEPPFQNLMFLIRDWQNADEYDYGIDGGENFLEASLKLDKSMSLASKRSRRMIRQCFKEVSCCLMPEPGKEVRENKNFDGDVKLINKNFLEKMAELFSALISPNALNIKTICGEKVNGKDLLEYFQTYVEKFNSDEIPEPIDLVEATAKTHDVLKVIKIKEIYISDMRKELDCERFLSLNELNELNAQITNQIQDDFNKDKKTTNPTIVREILELINKELASGYQQILNDHNKKCDEILSKLIENCQNFYIITTNESLESSFVTPEIFEDLSNNAKTMAHKMFTDFCQKESNIVLEPYLIKMSAMIEKEEMAIKSENSRLFNESFNTNTEAVNISFEYYSTQMNLEIKENYFFEENLFAKSEQKIRADTIILFSEKCKFGDQNFIHRFRDQLNTKLKEAFQQFENLNETNIKNLLSKTEKGLTDSIKFYTESFGNIELFSSKNELEVKHKEVSEKANYMIDQFNVLNYSKFIVPYKTKLNEEIDKIYSLTISSFEENITFFTSFCENKVEETLNLYSNEMKNLLDEKDLSEINKLEKIKPIVLNEVISKFAHVSKINIYDDIENFIKEKITNEIDLLLMNKLVNQYITDMNTQLENELYLSRRELNIMHIENKLKVADSFNDNIKSKDFNFIKSIKKSLKTNLESMYQKIFDENEKRRDNVINDVILKCRDDYYNEMQTKLNDSHNYLSFDDLSEQVKQNLLKYLIEICNNEKELYKQYYDYFNQVIVEAGNKIRIPHKESEFDSKTKNNKAVFDASMIYNEKMASFLISRVCTSMDLFEQNETSIREEAMNLFTENCDKFGVQEFSVTLVGKLNESKLKLKSQFSNELKQLTDVTTKALTDSLFNYTESIRKEVELMPNTEEFIKKHEMIKNKSFEIFREKCIVNNDKYIESYISRLETKINKAFEKFKSTLFIKTQEFCMKTVNDYYNNYVEYMIGLTDQSNGVLLDKELEDYHEKLNSKLVIELQNELTKLIDSETMEKYESDLLSLTCKEYERISRVNNALLEIRRQSLEIQIREHLNEYKISMQNVNYNCITGEDLLNLHISYKMSVLEKFSEWNSFQNSENFEPYNTVLESEIEKFFEEMQSLQSENTEIFTKVTVEAKDFYKREMERYIRQSSTFSIKVINDYHIIIINEIFEKYQPLIKHLTNDKFEEAINSEMKPVYDYFINKVNTKEIIIGIDLGTTNVRMAYYKTGGIEVIPSNSPCVIYIGDNGLETVGVLPKDNQNNSAIYSCKRLIGRDYSNPEFRKYIEQLPFKVVELGNNLLIQMTKENQQYYFDAEQITAKILKHTKNQAEQHLRCTVNGAVISVPSIFTDAQRVTTKQAALTAGFNVVKLISSPAATALEYKANSLSNQDLRNLLIFDFGAGYLDVAIIALHRDSVEVKSIGGDCNIGGEDIDHVLVQYCIEKFFKSKTKANSLRDNAEGVQAIKRLTEACEQKKALLKGSNSVDIVLRNFYNNQDLKVNLTKQKFDELNQELFDKSIEVVNKALTDAQLTANDIDDFILVGGSSNITKIREMLKQLFVNKPLNIQMKENAVAIGAAYYAAQLSDSILDKSMRGFKLDNIAPISLGYPRNGDIFCSIIKRRTKLPHRKTITFTTSEDNQTNVSFLVYEGEDIRSFNNKFCKMFNINGIPAAPAGRQLIDITFEITDEAILQGKAKLKNTNMELEILAFYGKKASTEI